MNTAIDEQARIEDIQQLRGKARQRRWLLTGAGAAVVGLLAYGSYWWVTGRFMESTDDAYLRADWVSVSARIPGYVAEVRVADDQPVQAGQVLMRLQDHDYLARRDQAWAERDQANAALAAGRAALAVAIAQMGRQHEAITKFQAVLSSALAERQRASLDLQRYKGLVSEHAATAQRLESAQAGAFQANAQEKSARAGLAEQQSLLQMAEAQVQAATAHVSEAGASLAAAEARLVLAEQDQNDTLVRSPINGVVGQRRVRAGQYLVPGQPLLAVVPLEQTYVVANFKETQLARLQPGQPVDIAVDGDDGQPLQGRVASFSPGSGAVFALLPSDNATGNFTKIVQRFPVRILLEPHDSKARILPGMSVIATVDTRPQEARHEQ